MQTDGRTTHPGAEGITSPPVTSGILGLSEETLQHLLPFHLIWDNGGQLDRISDALKRLWRLPVAPIEIHLQRPFKSRLEGWMFAELTRMVLTISADETSNCPLRGELIALDHNRWLFTGVPAIGRVSELGQAGLQLSDLPLHTGLGDALIATEAALSSLELSESERQRLNSANRLLTAMDEAMGTTASGPQGEAYFRALIENSADLTLILDESGTIRYASPSVKNVLGHNPRSLVGTGVESLVDPADLPTVMATITQVVLAGETRSALQFRCPTQDGSLRHLEAVGRVFGEEQGKAQVVMNARDVTERIALEFRLRQSQKLESIGRLAGGVAHDINNILTVIQGHTSLIQMSKGLSSDDIESIHEILVATERAAALTRQLLTFSRRQAVKIRAFNVGQVVAGMADMLRRILGEDLVLELEMSPGPMVIRGDAGMLEQVVMTLSANSRDAMPEGGRLLIHVSPVTLDVGKTDPNSDARPGDFIRLCVTDTGTGISPSNMERLFEPFFTTKEFGQGNGLGLTTVHGILKLHGGWVEVESEVNQGTVFRSYWPAENPGALGAVPGLDDTRKGAGEPGQCGAILVVEDEEPLRLLVVEVLRRRGYKVIEAKSGAEALRIWPQHREDVQVLLTDIVMPDGVSGWELAKRLQSDKAGLSVIYTSGYSPDFVDEDGRFLEGRVFLQKPYDPETLVDKIRACISGK